MMDDKDMEIKVLKEEAERDAKRIQELESSLKELYLMIKDYDIVNSDDEIGVVMPNRDKEKMRRAEALLKHVLENQRN